jgi:hypothetical protein
MAINDNTRNATVTDGIVGAFGSTDAANKRMADHVERENKKMQEEMQRKTQEEQVSK